MTQFTKIRGLPTCNTSVNRGGFLNYLWFLIINFNKLYDVHTFLISKPKY